MRKNKDLVSLFEMDGEDLGRVIAASTFRSTLTPIDGGIVVSPVDEDIKGPITKTTTPGGGAGDATGTLSAEYNDELE